MATFRVGSKTCSCKHQHHSTSLVAITGGPGSGKTAILEMALHSFCSHVGVLPESAGIVFGGGFPRHESDVAQRAAQRAIFHIQEQMEALTVGERRVAVALCDRGTVDGLAYWPGSEQEYWDQFDTTHEAQLARYRAVIHMRTPAAVQGYDQSNVLRIESAEQARALDEKIMDGWSRHPNRIVVESDDDFLTKARTALEFVRQTLPNCCRAHGLVVD